MMGPNGFYTLACDYFFIMQNKKEFHKNVMKIVEDQKRLIYCMNEGMYEILYGVAGYLYCLLYLQKRYQNPDIPKEFQINLSKQVVNVMQILVKQGFCQYYKNTTNKFIQINKLEDVQIPEKDQEFRLFYLCFGEEYIGGAHGLIGILYMLLLGIQLNQSYFIKTKQDKLLKVIYKSSIKSIKWLLQLQVKNGNFPPCTGDKDYEKVQFCHGSPGSIPLFIISLELAKDKMDDVQKALIKAAQCTWEQGLTKKGLGLCHGISGNGQFLLSMYNFTKEEIWLKRSLLFGIVPFEKIYNHQIKNYKGARRKVRNIPDQPYSLQTGMAGNIHFYADLFDPKNAYYPGYEI